MSDNPALTCRLPGMEKCHPERILLDRQLRVRPEATILPGCLIYTTPQAPQEKADILSERGAVVERLQDCAIASILELLANRGITRLLLEAGPTLSSAFLAADLVDRVYWYRAPITIGYGRPALSELSEKPLAELPRFHRIDIQQLDNDVVEIYQHGAPA
jgi:diaminohydroxyphosphoribosylaminopyrimidine deaminase/5-amino-6-(5-phosphoribosylamino)uracil reductase